MNSVLIATWTDPTAKLALYLMSTLKAFVELALEVGASEVHLKYSTCTTGMV